MMTARGWWCLVGVVLALLAGVLANVPALLVTGLALLLWFGWEWLCFAVRVRTLRQRLRIHREVWDDRGPVSTLWAGRSFTVKVELHLREGARLPWLAIADPVPFGVRHEEGETTADGELRGKSPLAIEYKVHCPLTGLARFEGLRIEMTDLQGFFAFVTFLRDPLVLLILPSVLVHKSGGPTVKRHNQLPPPGIHRLRQPGSGGELLDLRDYLTGDPPRTIAWKVSARRDRLVTKVFESEVPVRCTLFLDTSNSVRVPSPAYEPDSHGKNKGRSVPPYFKPLDRLVELAAGVIRANASIRDLTGLCLFDEHGSRVVRPERTSTHQNRLMQLLGEAAALAPIVPRADPEALTPTAYALAQEVYPDLLRSEVNHMPGWLAWLVAFPFYSRHSHGLLEKLHRRKLTLLKLALLGAVILPEAVALVALWGKAPPWTEGLLGALLFLGVPLLLAVGIPLFLFSLLVSGRRRRLARWRKRLSALFSVQQGLSPGGIETLMQDDDAFSMHQQQFLADHQVPCYVPLYDEHGRYQFAAPEKVRVLANAIVAAAARGRDNELYVLLADLLELDSHLEPLLAALRVALGRHHQVLIVCPWPQGVPLPDEETSGKPGKHKLRDLLTNLTHKNLHAAYSRLRRTLAGLGVQVICAAHFESAPLILKRLERIRTLGGRR
jgi:uncharacterized protein (DUF58 family)